MNRKTLAILVCAAFAPAAFADNYNQSITAIFGAGNPDTGWTTDTGLNGLVLGLRAKNRTDASTPNDGAGTYTFATAPAPRGLWNYEFSINSGTSFLSAYDYYLSVDRDASPGVSFTTIDPLAYWLDNSYGTAGTANGAGLEGPSSSFVGSSSIAQNSENITFGDYPGGALALTPNATYTYSLYAVEKGAGPNAAPLTSVTMNVRVGDGGSSVPDSGSTVALLGGCLVGFAALRRRFKRA